MSRPIVLLSVFAVICLAQEAPSPQTAPPKLFDIPIVDCSGLLCVTVTSGNGQALKLALDLGARNAYLDTEAAKRLGLQAAGLNPSDTARNAAVQQGIVPGAKLGDLPLGDFPFMILDTAPDPTTPNSKAQPLPADGALTFGSFANRLVELDVAKHLIRVSEPLTDPVPCSTTCSDIVLRRTGKFGPITLTTDGFEVNSQPVSVQIDTLFTGSILVYPDAVEKLGLKKASKARQKETFPFAQDGLELTRGPGATITFRGIALSQEAPVYFWREKTETPPATQVEATMGTALLSNAVAHFDFKGKHFWMTPNHP